MLQVPSVSVPMCFDTLVNNHRDLKGIGKVELFIGRDVSLSSWYRLDQLDEYKTSVHGESIRSHIDDSVLDQGRVISACLIRCDGTYYPVVEMDDGNMFLLLQHKILAWWNRHE